MRVVFKKLKKSECLYRGIRIFFISLHRLFIPKMVNISIIIPIYNVEKYVLRCLRTIVGQDTDVCTIQCILVDDCGTDGSMSLVRDFISSYSGDVQFVILKHDTNRGLSAARNTGLRAATGDFLLYVDSDDGLADNCLKLMADELEQHQETDVVMGNIYVCKSQSPFMPTTGNVRVISDKREAFADLFAMRLNNSACNKLVRRELIMKQQLFFQDGLLYEDLLWNYRLFSVMTSIVVMPQVTYIYENNPVSIVNTTKTKVEAVTNSFITISNYVVEHPYRPLIGDSLMYAFGILLKAVDAQNQYGCSSETRRKLQKAKNRLMALTLKSGRLLMAVFFLVMYKPFSWLLRLPFFRKHYHQASMIVSKIERRS